MATRGDETIENLPKATASGDASTGGVIRDSRGVAFDPAKHKHRVDPDGTKSPELGKTGRFLLIKRRDRIAKAQKDPLGQLDAPRPDESDERDEPDEYRAAAGVVVKMIEGSAVMLLSENCKMDTATRDEMLVAWTAYFRARGVVNIPPSFMVISATALYLGKSVANEPTARRKIQGAAAWIISRASRLRGTKLLAAPATPPVPAGKDLSRDAGTAQGTES